MATRHTFDEGNVASTHGTRRCAAVGRAGDIAHAVSEAAQVEREHPAEQLRRSTRLQQPHHTQRAREELCSFGARILRERSIAKLHALEERRVHEARSSTFLGLGLGLEQLGDLDRLVQPWRHDSQHNECQLDQCRGVHSGALDLSLERSEGSLAEIAQMTHFTLLRPTAHTADGVPCRATLPSDVAFAVGLCASGARGFPEHGTLQSTHGLRRERMRHEQSSVAEELR